MSVKGDDLFLDVQKELKQNVMYVPKPKMKTSTSECQSNECVNFLE